MATNFNGMSKDSFLNELVAATGLNGKELLNYLLDRINMEPTSKSPTVMQAVQNTRNDVVTTSFVDLCYSDADKFTVSLIMQKEFNRYNHVMGDLVCLSTTVYSCKAKDNSLFEMRIDVGVKGYRPAFVEIYHPVGEYKGPCSTTKYGVIVNHYVVEDLSAYEY